MESSGPTTNSLIYNIIYPRTTKWWCAGNFLKAVPISPRRGHLSPAAYAVLHGELRNVGAMPGPTTHDIFDLDRPNLDWVAMAGSMGVEAVKVDTAEQFNKALAAGFHSRGPMLIEAMV